MESIIKRHFTKELEENPDISVFDLFKWKYVDIEIKNQKTGETIYSIRNAEFPEHYSQQACDIIASKYFFRGADETSLKDTVRRMANFWTDQLVDEGLITTKETENIFYDEIVYALLSQMWAPNSPQWFNTGIADYWRVYGDSDYLYYWDENKKKAVKSKDRYSRTQASACFILDVKDKLLGKGSISDHYVTETKLFKGGSGTGSNFSNIRAAGEKLSTGGTSSGLMSFLEGLDKNAGAIKSGGTTRRAAKMVIIDIDHPEIEDFIEWKAKEERKAKVLGEAGYSMEIGGEAYSTVSGQNSNNSIRVSNDFMELVKSNDSDVTYRLKGRVDDTVSKDVNVQELWNKIAQAAWECGDPALQFSDTIEEWNTCQNSGPINATNPCSEFAFLDNTACNLASINLLKFLDEDINFKYEDFEHLTGLIQLVLEASIHGGQFPTKEIAENSYKFRPTGLGITNLAAFLLKKRIPYDSEDGRLWTATICSILTAVSYITSAKMAKIVGPFPAWHHNHSIMDRIIKRHESEAKALEELIEKDSSRYEYDLSKNITWAYWLWRDEIEKDVFSDGYSVCKGFRNAQVTCIAPTGTISLAMDCYSTGIEPFYSHKTYKKMADGSFMEINNPLYEELLSEGLPKLIVEDIAQTANDISPMGHVLMMSAIQPFISGAISKTVNLPNEATVEDIKKIYLSAWETGCKSIAIYRDGSKGTQVLTKEKKLSESGKRVLEQVNELAKENKKKSKEILATIESGSETKTVSIKEIRNFLLNDSLFRDEADTEEPKDIILENLNNPGEYVIALDYKGETYIPQKDIDKFKSPPKRVKPVGVRSAVIHPAKIDTVELYISIGFYEDGKMSEIFVSTDKEGTAIKGLLASLSKSLSHMLQYGIEPKNIAKMLRAQKYEPSGIVERHPYIKMVSSISDLISKVIEIETGDYSRCEIKPAGYEDSLSGITGHHVKHEDDGERVYGESCPQCGSTMLVNTGVCKTCLDCGSTTGCS